MKTPSSIAALLEQPMNRKEFLKHLGIGALMMLGAGSIVRSLGGFESLERGTSSRTMDLGYGSSVYGGRAQ